MLTARGLITDIDKGKMKGEWVNCKWARSKMNEMDGKLKDLTNFFLEVGRLILFLEILQKKKNDLELIAVVGRGMYKILWRF